MRGDYPEALVVLLHRERHWLLGLGVVLRYAQRCGLQWVGEFRKELLTNVSKVSIRDRTIDVFHTHRGQNCKCGNGTKCQCTIRCVHSKKPDSTGCDHE